MRANASRKVHSRVRGEEDIERTPQGDRNDVVDLDYASNTKRDWSNKACPMKGTVKN